jgi:hypothetical protein
MDQGITGYFSSVCGAFAGGEHIFAVTKFSLQCTNMVQYNQFGYDKQCRASGCVSAAWTAPADRAATG